MRCGKRSRGPTLRNVEWKRVERRRAWVSAACFATLLTGCSGTSGRSGDGANSLRAGAGGADADAAGAEAGAAGTGTSTASPAPECYARVGSPVDIDAFDGGYPAFALSDGGVVGVAVIMREPGYRIVEFTPDGEALGTAQTLWTEVETGYQLQLAVSQEVLAVADVGHDAETEQDTCRLAMARLGELTSIRPPTVVGSPSGAASPLNGLNRCVVAAVDDGFVVLWHVWKDMTRDESTLFAQGFDCDGNETGERLTVAAGQAQPADFPFASDGARVVVPVYDTHGGATGLAFIENGELSIRPLDIQTPLASLAPVRGGFIAATQSNPSSKTPPTLMLLDRDAALSSGPVQTDDWMRVAALGSGYVVVANDNYLVARTLNAEFGALSPPTGLSEDPTARLDALLYAPDDSRVGLIYSEDGHQRFVRLECSDRPAPAPGSATCPEKSEITPLDDGCTDAICHIIVRLDYLTLGLRGWAAIGAAANPVDSAGAVAQAAAAFEGKMSGVPTSVSGPDAGLFAARIPAADYGGFVLVGEESGLAVAAGGIVWSGVGEYWTPTAWNDAGALACGDNAAEPTDTYLDPSTCQHSVQAQTPATASEALDVVLRSNLAAHVASEGPFSAYALLYTRTVGECSPQNAEYLVVLTRGP